MSRVAAVVADVAGVAGGARRVAAELDETSPVEYTLRRTARRRTVGIYVEPDRRVIVLAPEGASAEQVERIVRRRLRWIRRQQRVVDALPPPETPREWVAGETHRYLGRQYRLKLQTSAGGAPDRLQRSVRLVGRYFAVSLPDPKDRTAVRDLMGDWYRTHAQRVIAERVRKLVASTHWLELDPANPPAFRLQALTHRWGSTTRAGRITFNRALIRLPLGCIDYVVAHELVHLRIPNHSPAFWRMLERVMPDWRQWRERLGREGV